MSERDNVFPFGKFDGMVETGKGVDPTIMAVLNGLQNNMMVVLQKIEILEYKLKELESCSSDTQK